MGKDGKIVPYAFTRRQPFATDVTIQIAYVSICSHCPTLTSHHRAVNRGCCKRQS